jgi:hypothetical protein
MVYGIENRVWFQGISNSLLLEFSRSHCKSDSPVFKHMCKVFSVNLIVLFRELQT